MAGERDQGRLARVFPVVQVRVLALRLRAAAGREARHDGSRVPADAEGRELQPRRREGEDRGRQSLDREVGIFEVWAGGSSPADKVAHRAAPKRCVRRCLEAIKRSGGAAARRANMKKCRFGLALPVMFAAMFAVGWAAPGLAQAPLSSWNDTASKTAIVGFVERVTKQGSPEFVPEDQRVATFDNDGTLWGEQPLYYQLFFAIDRVKALAPHDARAGRRRDDAMVRIRRRPAGAVLEPRRLLPEARGIRCLVLPLPSRFSA